MSAEMAGQLALPLDVPSPQRIAGPRSRYSGIAEYLHKHPGEWGPVAYRPSVRSAQLFAADIRRGRPRVLAGCEARVQRGFEVWARWPKD